MLKTDEHVMAAFTWKSALLFLLAFALLTAPLWWAHLRKVSAMPQTRMEGEWVGTANVRAGDGSGSQATAAVLYLNLAKADPFLSKVHGPGQLCIRGESHVRTLNVLDLSTPSIEQGSTRVSGSISGDLSSGGSNAAAQGAGRVVSGSLNGGDLQIEIAQDGFSPGLTLKAKLQRRTHDDFARLCRAQ